uniref:Uncharacterized protein n=1 Tax=Medicago truncatula TaxID=3880 RepID=Q2HU13_MEDTR|nr:hypothetical protein MtrDRAFT_AC149491g13v2 [Medicago truncatula]
MREDERGDEKVKHVEILTGEVTWHARIGPTKACGMHAPTRRVGAGFRGEKEKWIKLVTCGAFRLAA